MANPSPSVRQLLPLPIVVAMIALIGYAHPVMGDSVNSPNITMNVDTNRSVGAGAGNTAITVNTITIAEISLAEYSAGTSRAITLKVRPGYQFDSSSPVTAQSATFGINGGALNAIASITPAGTAAETLTFSLTSAAGNSTSVQDIIRVNGVKLKIISAAGAAGPAQTTVELSTSSVGGAFNGQGIVAANITRGAAHNLQFLSQPGDVEAGALLLPQVKIVDFGGNVLTNVNRTISLALQANPGSASLQGTTSVESSNGISAWIAGNGLAITTAATGYTLRASHSGANFLSSDTADSSPFTVSASDPGGLEITSQPGNVAAGDDILLALRVVDEFGNPVTSASIPVTLDTAVNPGGWPLLVDTSLTKTTVSGVVSWGADDNLRATKAISGYKLIASGLGDPVTTSAFDIAAGTASRISFIQQPVNLVEDTTMSPAPTAEITDAFGNRVNTSATVTLGLSAPFCNATMSPLSLAATGGLVTFDPVSIDGPCEDIALSASLNGLVGGVSDSFDVKAADAFPIAINGASLKKGKLFSFSSRGTFRVSSASIDDPTKKGATLTVTGTTGKVRYVLPRTGWKKTGNGSFQFSGSKCQRIAVSKKALSASCAGKTGTLDIPETELSLSLALGKGTEQFCGVCGGTSRGNESKSLNRINCARPEFCP